MNLFKNAHDGGEDIINLFIHMYKYKPNYATKRSELCHIVIVCASSFFFLIFSGFEIAPT